MHPRVKINVQGGGSTSGIIAVSSGACNVGMSSRLLKPEETELRTIAIAQDAIALIVHPGNLVTNLTLEQIQQVFAGKICNWKDLGGHDARIVVVTREEGSGTRGAFVDLVMAQNFISDEALVQDSNGAVREIVVSDENAIGYISFGILDHRVKALDVAGITPTIENIVVGKYLLKRNFLLLTKDCPQPTLVDSFVRYVLSDKGQTSLAEEGLIPIQQ